MDLKRKKELLNEWKNRRPEMGIITIRCKDTGDLFAGISKDTQVEFNSQQFKLSVNLHPNKQLQKLWEQYGENGFDYTVVKVLKYEDPKEDQTDKLMELLDEYLAEMPQARRLSK